MALNTSAVAVVAARRQRVASLRLKGATLREIQGILQSEGRPASLGTVHSDLKALEAEWEEQAAADIAQHRTRQLAELAEVKREAWRDGRLSLVLQALRQESEITGTKSPSTRVEGETPLAIIIDR